MELIHKNIRIKGRVQGVGFRYSARLIARELGIRGFVRNLSDGSVYIEAEGTAWQLENFMEWCNSGPARAVIQNVDVYDGELANFIDFNII